MERASRSVEARFCSYVACVAEVLGHLDRVGPMRDYCMGLMMPGERKSVEPMAAIMAPSRAAAEHQSLLHFVGQSPWSDEAVLAKVRELVVPAIEARGGPIEAWIVDDTGFAKKGVHSVGVARQYCGRVGKVDNCQIAVTLSLANHAASLPIAYRLYLPEAWIADKERRRAAHVPDTAAFKTKLEISLEQIRAALAAGVRPGVVLADAAYGTNGAFRAALGRMGLSYAVGVQSNVGAWAPGVGPLPPGPWSGRGHVPTRFRRDAEHKPVRVKALALGLPAEAWKDVAWREGSNAPLASRFAALRVRVAGGHEFHALPPEEWLVVEWPEGEAEPTKYWLSTLPADAPLAALVDTAKLRWRIERDYEELKSELGLAHFEGRGWRGFHHHATMCIAAYGFLIRERAEFPPSDPPRRQKTRLSNRPRPRSAADPARTPHRKLNRDVATKTPRRSRRNDETMSMLPLNRVENAISCAFVTQ